MVRCHNTIFFVAIKTNLITRPMSGRKTTSDKGLSSTRQVYAEAVNSIARNGSKTPRGRSMQKQSTQSRAARGGCPA